MKVKLSYYLILLCCVFGSIFTSNSLYAQATVTLNVTPSVRSERIQSDVLVRATLSAAQSEPVTVFLSFSGTATNDVDYTRNADVIVINPGQTTGSIKINNKFDVITEGDETVVVSIINVVNATTAGNQTKTYTIKDNTSFPTVSLLLRDIYNPIQDENAGVAYIVAELSELSDFIVSIPLAYSGTATGGGVDYNTDKNAIVIPAGKLRDSLKITAVPDGILEGDETVIMDMLQPKHIRQNEENEPEFSISKNGDKYVMTFYINGYVDYEQELDSNPGFPMFEIKEGFQQETLIITDSGITTPEGYSVSIDQNPIDETSEENVSFTFDSAEIGTTYSYTFTSSGGGTTVTGSGTITASNQQISNIDLSSLPVGLITLSATLTNDIGLEGAPATDTSTKVKELTITVNSGQAKVYGDPDPIFTYTASGFDGTDTVVILTGQLSRTPGETVGSYPILLGTLSAGPYYTINFVGANFTISNKLLTITAEASSKTYGDTDPVFTYTATGFIDTDDETIISGSLTREVGEDVGNYTILLGSLSAPGYDISFNTSNFEITPKELIVTADAHQSKIYGDEDPELTFTANGFTNGDNNDVLSGSLSREDGENVGDYEILIETLSAGENYTINYTSDTFEITSRTLTITTDLGQNKQYGSPEPTLTYTVSNLAESDTKSILVGELTRAPGETIGTYPISQGSLTTNSNYTILFEGADFYITQRILNITANANQFKTYGEEDPEFTFTAEGFVASEDESNLTGVLTREAGENVGIYEILIGTLSAGENYVINYTSDTFEIKKAIIDGISLLDNSLDNEEFIYDGTPKSLEIDGDIPEETTIVYTNNEQTNVGTYEVTATISGDNYEELVLTATLTISPKELNITANANQFKTYGEEDPEFTFTAEGFVASDDESILTGALTREVGENVGNYEILIGTLSAGENYVINYTSNTFEIKKATIDGISLLDNDLDNEEFIYDGTPKSLEIDGDIPEETTIVYTNNEQTNVGTYEVTATISGDNYEELVLTATLTISPKELNITVNPNQFKTYGEEDPEFTFSADGFVASDDESILTGALTREVGENVGNYEILIGTLSAGENYVINYTSDTFEIKKATIDGISLLDNALDNEEFIYDGTPKSLEIEGDIPEETTIVYTNNEQTNVGTYEVTATISGDNYEELILTATLTISPKELNITANPNQFKTYDEEDPEFTFSAEGFVASDDESILTGALTREAGENVGNYEILIGTLSAGENYVINYTSNTFEIKKADQIITWEQTLSFGCDDSTTLILSAVSNSGLPVRYSATNTNIASVNNTTLTKNAPGTTTITVYQDGNDNYNPATSISKDIVINTPGLISQYWVDVLVFDNSSKQYVSYQWFKNGVAISGATSQYYSENNPLSGTYHAEAMDINGNKIITCPLEIEGGNFSRKIKIIPNPVRQSTQFTVECSFDAELLQGATIHIFDLNGRLLQTVPVTGTRTQTIAPSQVGMYIVIATLSNGKRITANLAVN
ncbi:MBG domain-containing protein [Joostella sp. CR20]|uniref:MBG domain-containing protein n=1 Tax=Joostella sp. CR20 TaxID=2804312 RepID=UPI00313D152C